LTRAGPPDFEDLCREPIGGALKMGPIASRGAMMSEPTTRLICARLRLAAISRYDSRATALRYL